MQIGRFSMYAAMGMCVAWVLLFLVLPVGLINLSQTLSPGGVWMVFMVAVVEFTAALVVLLHYERRIEQLTASSHSDALTGLWNRHYFYLRLETEMKRAERTGSNMAILLMDVDNFKTVNDTFGHVIGDQVLQDLAMCMRQICRGSDVLSRLGGDEFAIFTPSTTARQAALLAHRLRQSICLHMPAKLALSVSIGVSDLSDITHFAVLALMEAADVALYTAKYRGKNQVCLRNTLRPFDVPVAVSAAKARWEAFVGEQAVDVAVTPPKDAVPTQSQLPAEVAPTKWAPKRRQV